MTVLQPIAAGAGPQPLQLTAGEPLFARAKVSGPPGGYYATPLLDILRAPDAVYVPGTDGWVGVDMKTWAIEWLPLDAAVYRVGRFDAAGISDRYGPVAWGKEFCRLVAARERPHGAVEVKITPVQPSAGDAPAPLWVGDQLDALRRGADRGAKTGLGALTC